MNTERKINVSYSSLVDLKAELRRKHDGISKGKSSYEILYTDSTKLTKLRKKTKQTDDENDGSSMSKTDKTHVDYIMHKKSRLMLHAKAKVYDKLQNMKTKMNNGFAVDFHKTCITHSNAIIQKHDDICYSDDDWVDYIDCFGRTRKCLSVNLPTIQEEDNLIRENVMEDLKEENVSKWKQNNFQLENTSSPSYDDIHEIQKNCEDYSTTCNKDNVHYQDLVFDEARTHGVGYYAFSQNEEERIKQQMSLFKLRKQTEVNQKCINKIKSIKCKIIQNRLRVAMLRHKIRSGSSSNTIKQTDINFKNNKLLLKCTDSEIEADSKKQNFVENIETIIQNNITLPHTNNKTYVMSQEEWIYKQRQNRHFRFAPYYNQLSNTNLHNYNSNTKSDLINLNNANCISEIAILPRKLHKNVSNKYKSDSCITVANESYQSVESHVVDGLKYLRRQLEDQHRKREEKYKSAEEASLLD